MNCVSSPYAESVLPVTVVGEGSPCPCLNPQAVSSSYFLPLLY